MLNLRSMTRNVSRGVATFIDRATLETKILAVKKAREGSMAHEGESSCSRSPPTTNPTQP
jgi:hypothetical protein